MRSLFQFSRQEREFPDFSPSRDEKRYLNDFWECISLCFRFLQLVCFLSRNFNENLMLREQFFSSSINLVFWEENEKIIYRIYSPLIWHFTILGLNEMLFKQARKLGRCDSYIRNLKLTDWLTDWLCARRCYRIKRPKSCSSVWPRKGVEILLSPCWIT